MNVGIMCGSYSGTIDTLNDNNTIAELVTRRPYNIVMSSGESGSMGQVKEIVRANKRKLIVVGNSFELVRSHADEKIPVNSTFERTAKIYEKSDAILVLTGGTGTLSEFMAFLNNKIETKDEKPLIVYNENGNFKEILADLENRKKAGLIDDSYDLYFKVARNINDLAAFLQEAEEKYARKMAKTGGKAI